jgi:hypothetical protein
MATFPIQIDATQLFFKIFQIPPATSTWQDATSIQTLQLEPGEHYFQVASGYYADFTFIVTPTGTVDYKPGYGAYLSGRGTETLTLLGFPVTLDATELSGAGVYLAETSPKIDFIKRETIRLVPAGSYKVQQGSGQLAYLSFKVGQDGIISYQPAYDVNDGGFLSGTGTTTLTFHGYRLQIDGSALGTSRWSILTITGLPYSSEPTRNLNILPAPVFTLRSDDREVDDLSFFIDLSGTVSFDPALSARMQLTQLPNGLPVLHLERRDAQTSDTAPKLPFIDPDLIGPDDFRTPSLSSAPSNPFGLWLLRRGVIDKMLADLRVARVGGGPGGLTAVLGMAFGTPLPDFDGLYQALTMGDAEQTSATKKVITKLGLTVESFSHLVEIRAKDQQAQVDPRVTVSDDEWEDVYSVLAQAEKLKLFGAWRAQEAQSQILLGADAFWVSLREPVAGDWPPRQLVGPSPPAAPLIDPDLQTLLDLPEPFAGAEAVSLWKGRLSVLKAIKLQLATARQSGTFDAMLTLTFGDPLPNLAQLRKDLASSDASVAAAALKVVTDALHLTLDDFGKLMSVRDKDAQSDLQKKPVPAEYAQVYAILTRAWKIGKAYPGWITDETATFGGEGLSAGSPYLAYWRARKAVLPRWRASAEARQAWQQALRARSAPPIIDPDLVGPEDLRDPAATYPAYDLWRTRYDAVSNRVDAITTGAKTAVALDALLRMYLGIDGTGLLAIDTARSNGQSVQPRLDQLGLTNAAFNVLLGVQRLLGKSQPVLEQEWGALASILVQTYKMRQFAAWRLAEAEQTPPLLLGPDVFQIPPPPDDPLAPNVAKTLPPWRATREARRDWQDTLQSRIDEQAAVIDGMRTAVSATEAATIEPLRDGLVIAAQGGSLDLDHAADWVTKRFLVDAKAQACVMTTRVEQAIETLQGLLLGLSGGASFNPTGWENVSNVAAASWGGGRVDLFVRGADRALWHMWKETDGRWRDPEMLDTELVSAPAACSRGVGSLDVFAVRQGGELSQRSYGGGAWSDWFSLGSPPNTTLSTTPSVTSWGGDHLEVLVSASSGIFNASIWRRRFENGAWSDWTLLEGGLSTFLVVTSPSVMSRAPNELDVFVRAGGLLHLQYANGWAASPDTLEASWPHPAPALGVLPTPDGTVVMLFAVLDAGTVAWGSYNPDRQDWSGLTAAPDGVLIAPPAACVSTAAQVEVFGIGTNHQIYQASLGVSPVGVFLWAGGWSQVGPRSLTLNAPGFEAEWKWLGSYATWRAAMLVFLYPENLLLPTLRPSDQQTPGFRVLVNALSNPNNVTPEVACAEARTYSRYFEDVCTLQVEASAQHLAAPSANDCEPATQAPIRDLFYMFARGGRTNRLYWCAWDQYAPTQDYAQSPWAPINVAEQLGGLVVLEGTAERPATSVVSLIGASPHNTVAGRRYIALFTQVQSAGTQKLALLRFDVDSQYWDVANPDLSIPSVGVYFSAAVKQLSIPFNLGYLEFPIPPTIAVRNEYGAWFLGELSADSTGWQDGGMRPLTYASSKVFAFVEHGFAPESVLVESFAGGGLLGGPGYTVIGLPSLAGPPRPGPTVPDSTFRGLLWLPYEPTSTLVNDQSGIVGFIVCDVSGVPQVATLNPLDGVRATTPEVAEIESIIPHSGSSQNFGTSQFVVRRRQSKEFRRCAFAWSEAGLQVLSDEAVIPDVRGSFGISEGLSAAELQARRVQNGQTYRANASLSSSLRTYIEEAHYFVPMQIALQLHRAGQYDAALSWFRTVYDYTAPTGQRKIYYGLVVEETLPQDYTRAGTWLADPLNPHGIARTRRNAYTRYTLTCITRCLLDYADAAFAQDTAESLAAARNLYQSALDVLDAEEQQAPAVDCPRVVNALFPDTKSDRTMGAQQAELRRKLSGVTDGAKLLAVAGRVRALAQEESGTGFAEVRREADRAQTVRASRLGDVVAQAEAWRNAQVRSLIRNPALAPALHTVSAAAAATFSRSLGASADELTVGSALHLAPRDPNAGRAAEPVTTDMPPALAQANADLIGPIPTFAPSFALWGCIPPNAVANALRLHAKLNLAKLRSCRNIAGMKREVDAYSAPTNTTSALPTVGASGQLTLPGTASGSIQPTLYRYSVLVDRAKQLTQIALQMEAAMLAALQQNQSAAYGILRARQDLGVAQATVRLQELKAGEASENAKLAQKQRDRVDVQITHFTDLLSKPISDEEQAAMSLLGDAAYQQSRAASFSEDAANTYEGLGGGIGGSLVASILGGPYAAGLGTLVGGLGGGSIAALMAAAGAQGARAAFHANLAGQDSTNAAQLSALASYERRKEDWTFQQKLANQDAGIGDEQVIIAGDAVQVATQEKAIADAQHTNASDTLSFLSNAFLTPDLYSWLAGVLQSTYSFFLRQATALGRMAENQLAFERQEAPVGYVQVEYWATSGGTSQGSAAAPDRKGLTGAERLLQDITQLDQHAFLSDARKLQLTKTFSLDRLDPTGLQRLRETGVVTFATSMEAFDRDFPGHYLRLIKRVSVSVIALVPTAQGICATLSSNGISRVVISGDLFQVVPIRRSPESIALCSPAGATGISPLSPQAETMLLPFEDSGVDTSWELRMDKASNLFDYDTIADVLITIEYTALSSDDYRKQLIQSFDPTVLADRPYSLRNQFSDQWYELHNPDQSETPMTIRLSTTLADFPPNIDDVRIRQVLLYFSRGDNPAFEVEVTAFRFKEVGAVGFVGGGATSIDGIISTRRGNAGSWTSMIGKRPAGDWELTLPNTEEMRGRFGDDEIRDVLLVITYAGRTPERAS